MSPRYARLTLVLLLVALVPTAVNSYFGTSDADEPRLASVVGETLLGYTSTPTNRRAASIDRSFSAADWFERRYSRGGEDVKVLVVRSFDMKRLYHHPELAVASDMNFRAAHLETVAADAGDIHVHILEGESAGLIAYALVYGEATIARPLLFQLQVAPELLLRGRRPLTLALAMDEAHVPRDAQDLAQAPAVQLVAAVVAELRQAR